MLKTFFAPLPKKHKMTLAVVTMAVAIVLLLPSKDVAASRHTQATELTVGTLYPLELDLSQFPETVPEFEFDDRNWQTVTVRSGDNLAKLFNRSGLSPQDVYAVSRAGQDAAKLTKMMPGDELSVLIDESGQFSALKYRFSKLETLFVEANEQGELTSRIETKNVETRLDYASGVISSNFWNAGIAAGLTDNQIMSLAGLFSWDIDFALEIRQGDSFSVMFEKRFVDGEFAGYGDIIAAEFVNQGESFNAIRYEDGQYYTADGRSLRKSFLRAPVNFRYISSNFNPKRFHPVQKRVKPHRGVDYAADRGTPVMAAGDGKVIRAAYDRFNGHHVFIQHGERYTTKYLHFTKRAVKTGDIVKQGEVIGYVGATGMAAGVHLHYEFLVDGVHRNPRTVELPKADPIAASEKQKFSQLAEQYLAGLQNVKRILLAMN